MLSPKEAREALLQEVTLFSDGERLSRYVPFQDYGNRPYGHTSARLSEIEFATVCGGHSIPLVGAPSSKPGKLMMDHLEFPS